MKVLCGILAALLIATPLAYAGPPTKGFAVNNIIFYQPNDVLSQRLPGGADPFGAYIHELQLVLTDFFKDSRFPETFNTVVAIRPGNVSRVWFISSTRPGNTDELNLLRQKLEAIKPVDVTGGPVAFDIAGCVAGGDGKDPVEGKDFQLPLPREWRNAVKGKEQVLVPDGYLDLVWPAKP
jgi:hypothetical protein